MITITLTDDFIPATALLKLSGICATGGEAAHLIASGLVMVDGHTISEKRKKIRPGSIVTFADGGPEEQIMVVKDGEKSDLDA